MVWCSNCARVQPIQTACSSLICCNGCGKVVKQPTDSKKRSISGVTVGQHEQGMNSLNAGKSLKFDVAKFRALQATVSKKARGAVSSSEDPESLSDIDDAEVKSYLLKKDEHLFKKMMWERSNLEYAKAEAARKAAMKLKKEKQQMKAAETKIARNAGKTAVKTTSARVNYDVLKELLGESEDSEKLKKRRTDSCSENDAVSNDNESGQNKLNEWGMMNDDDDEETNLKCQNDPYGDYGEGQDYEYDDGYGDDLF